MPAAARRKPRARRSAPPPPAWRHRLPVLEQRHWDLIGLGLVALAVFLAFLVYLGWEGGQAGTALVDGLRDLVGEVHYLVPVALLAAGAILVMRPVLPAVRPFRAAALCLFAAGCLGLAAGTAGLGGAATAREDRGGLVGEGLYDAISTLLGSVGAHIIAIFLSVAGVLLLTGASIAGVLKATSDSVTSTGRRVRERAEPVKTAVTRIRTAREELAALEESGELASVTRGESTTVVDKRDFWSGADRFPDLYGTGSPEDPVPPEPAEPADDPRRAESPRSRGSPRIPRPTSPA